MSWKCHILYSKVIAHWVQRRSVFRFSNLSGCCLRLHSYKGGIRRNTSNNPYYSTYYTLKFLMLLVMDQLNLCTLSTVINLEEKIKNSGKKGCNL